MGDRPRRAALCRAALAFLALVGGGVWLAYGLSSAWAMASRPDRFSDAWYARGGLRRTVLIVVADLLGERGVLALAALAVAAFVGGALAASRHFRRVAALHGVARERASWWLAWGAVAAALVLVGVTSIATRGARPSPSPTSASSIDLASSRPPPAAPVTTSGAVRPNVVLIGAFGLRVDRLDPRTTPNLARLAGASARFERAYASTTKPRISWATLLSGRAPGRRACDASPELERGPADTLLSRFARAGYRVPPPFRHEPEDVVDPRDVASAALDAFGGGSGEPFFLAIQLASTTPPLLAPSSDRARFTDPAYRGPLKYAVRESASFVDARDVRQWHDLYDAAAFAEDAAIGRVLDALDARGLSDRTIVAVVSTHGELPVGAPASDPTGDDAAHVPWLIRAPGRAPRAAPEIVRDVDFAPTIHELAGVPSPPDLDGVSVAAALDGRLVEPRVAVSTLNDGGGGDDACAWSSRVARDGRFVLVHRPSRMHVEYLLLDEQAGPSREVDVSARFPEDARRLRAALSRDVLRDPEMAEQDGIFVLRAPPPSGLRDVVWIDVSDAGGPVGFVDALDRGVVFPKTYAVSLEGGAEEIRAMLSGARPRELDDVAVDGRGEAGEQGRDSEWGASPAPALPWLLRGRGYEARAFASPSRRSSLERALDASMDVHEARTMAADVDRFLDERASSPTFALLAPDASAAPDVVASVVRGLERRGAGERTVVVVTARRAPRASPSKRAVAPSPPSPSSPPRLVAWPGEASMRGTLFLSAHGLVPEAGRVDARVRTIDVVPTITELLGIEGDARTSGRSLLRLARGEVEPFERVVLVETTPWRGSPRGDHPRAAGGSRSQVGPRRARASLVRGHFHYVADLAAPNGAPSAATPSRERLYDLDCDPLERRDRSRDEPDVTAEMRARLVAARAGVRVPGDPEDPRREAPPRIVRLRFAGGERPRRVSGTVFVGERGSSTRDESPASVARTMEIVPVGVGREALRVEGDRVDLSFTTTPSSLVGVDVLVRPGARPIRWTFFLDDRPWPDGATFAGQLGLRAPELRDGLVTPQARFKAEGGALPVVDARRETGLFVVR